MNLKKITSFVMSALILSSTTTFAASNKLKHKRIYGKDRYETSAEVSKYGWNESSCAVICRGDIFPDALCSVPLAKKYDAPILLIQKCKLDENVKNELKRLNVQKVLIVGGKGAISAEVENEIRNISSIKRTIRLGGKDRYETSELIAKNVGSKGELILTSGTCPSDALSISPIAANKGIPIMLAKDKKSIKSYLNKNRINKSYIIGGQACVSKEIEEASPNVERIYGNNRYETNEKIIERFANTINFKKVYMTLAESKRGDEFADALTIGSIAAKENNPIVLINKDKGIYEKTKDFVQSKLSEEDIIIALGGENILSNDVLEKMCDMKVKNSKNANSNSKEDSSNRHSSAKDSKSDTSANHEKIKYQISMHPSFPGAFTYDLKVIDNKGEVLKGYKLLYDGKVIAEDENKDGVVRPLTIFYAKDIDKSKFKIVKNEKEISFELLNR